MKKISFIVVFALLLISMVGCGTKNPPANPQSTPSETSSISEGSESGSSTEPTISEPDETITSEPSEPTSPPVSSTVDPWAYLSESTFDLEGYLQACDIKLNISDVSYNNSTRYWYRFVNPQGVECAFSFSRSNLGSLLTITYVYEVTGEGDQGQYGYDVVGNSSLTFGFDSEKSSENSVTLLQVNVSQTNANILASVLENSMVHGKPDPTEGVHFEPNNEPFYLGEPIK